MDEYELYLERTERCNVWLSDLIRGLTETDYYTYMISIGMLKKKELEEIISDSINDYTKIFLGLKCQFCTQTVSRDRTARLRCLQCYCNYLKAGEKEVISD